VFFNKEDQDYMVDHDVEAVITAYAIYNARKRANGQTKALAFA
jgi:hypothetical protein